MKKRRLWIAVSMLALLSSCGNAAPLTSLLSRDVLKAVELPSDVNPTPVYEQNFNDFTTETDYTGTVTQKDWTIDLGNFSGTGTIDTTSALLRVKKGTLNLGNLSYNIVLEDISYFSFDYKFAANFGFDLYNITSSDTTPFTSGAATSTAIKNFSYHFDSPQSLELKIQLTNPNNLKAPTSNRDCIFDNFAFYGPAEPTYENPCVVTFINDGEEYASFTVEKNTDISKLLPDDPEKETENYIDYKFDNWFYDPDFTDKFGFENIIEDTTLYAHYTERAWSDEEIITDHQTKASLSYNYSGNSTNYEESFDSTTLGITTSYKDRTTTLDSGTEVLSFAYLSGGIQINTSKSKGIAINAKGLISEITITKTNATNGLILFSKDSPFTDASDYSHTTGATLIATINFTNSNLTQTYSFANPVQYLGICSANSSGVITNITYKTFSDYKISDVAIRFGGLMEKSTFDSLTNVTGYGVLLANTEKLAATTYASIPAAYQYAIDTGYTEISEIAQDLSFAYAEQTGTPIIASADKLPSALKNTEYYIFNAYVNVPSESLGVSITAVAYLIANGERVFFKEKICSAKSLANEYLDLNDETLPNDSLKALATK